MRTVRILGIGGTHRPESASELSVRHALTAAQAAGATVRLLPARTLDLPFYGEPATGAEPAFIDAVRWADGLIIGSPGYHGTVSGLLKNALDHLEALRDEPRTYLDSMAVGLIACAYGDQAAASTLATLRTIVHALRGWPTPLGVTINSALCRFGADGEPNDPAVGERLTLLGRQTVEFCRRHRRAGSGPARTEALIDTAW
ncbi:NADPH-dependent FMN reductase [Dactylosporangium sp. NPDC005572]|uniref:NADPH-dependent FMN reductase n=1 Tax=Dactylosporangium sp. NPDC005572 TaxID=3156889 RepID=UPI0033AE7D52